jgi:hypothetical protein
MALFSNFGVNHAKDVTGRCGIACAAYTIYASAQFLDFLELAENGDFWIGNESVP